MMALTTLLVQKGSGYYPVPVDMDKQKDILNEVSDQVVNEWDAVIEAELERVRSECLQADIDFEFVIDSSGSVGPANWDLTMRLIGEYWIKQVIVPNDAHTCGNHVAGHGFQVIQVVSTISSHHQQPFTTDKHMLNMSATTS